MGNLQNFSLEQIFSLSAISISLVSFFMGFGALVIQRRHYRQSVRPICSINYLDYMGEISLFVANDGVGPMFIDEIEIKHRGVVYDDISKLVGLELSGRKKKKFTWITVKHPRSLPKEKYLTLFSFKKSKNDENWELSRDAYNKKFPVQRRSLSSFKRKRSYGIILDKK